MSHETLEFLAIGETIREEADYSIERRIDEVRSRSMIDHAEVFVRTCAALVESIETG
jgi:uncharacterized protein (UPF0332 family)